MIMPSRFSSFMLLGISAVAGSLSSVARAEQTFPADQIEFFEKNVRPVLVENCQECHGAKKQKNGLRLDSRDAVLQGSEYKKVVVLGDPENSLLIKAVRHAAGPEPMPEKKPQLASNQIDALAQWIKMGLPWPKEIVAASSKPKWQDHWAYQKISNPPVPAVQNPKLAIQNQVDAFVAIKLSAAGLDFSAPADRSTLARRLYLDVTGLLPTYAELQAYLNDKSPEATTKLIDKLLDSPRYGERWARHWLDVARYSDTDGYHAGGVDNRFPHAYTYRDWVIKSLNADMPYDQFLTFQLAADKVQKAEGSNANLAALGLLTIGDYFLGDGNLQTDDRIDIVGRGMMGLTIGCARCHDHKYDPIASKDYYALYSVFNSSMVPKELPIIGECPDKVAAAEFQKKTAVVEDKMAAFREEVHGELRKPDRLRDYLLFSQKVLTLDETAMRGEAGKAKLRDRFVTKWREFVKRYAMTDKPNPVMLAWKEFAKLPADQFETQAVEVALKLSKPEGGANGVIRNELAKRPAPKSMQDVGDLYANIFLTCLSGTQPDNGDWKEVRSILQDPVSPMSVPVEDVERYFTRKDIDHMTGFRNEIKKLEITEEGAPLRAMVMEDKPKPQDGRVFIRGNPARPGDPAPRAYPGFLGGQKFTEGSGRLELAKLIASKDNPLTARVIVNRVWMYHFGKPLVAQTSDFGVQSAKPEQLQLLDYLATDLMEHGWSLKKLHRHILNSRTYQQSCLSTPEKDLKDAENNLLSHMNRTRLDYETMRDTLLEATASLNDGKMGGRSVPLNKPEANTRRSVYLFVDRYEQATVPAMFDFANPDSHSPQRFVTTVPQQTLFLMNSPFMKTQSETLATKLPVEGSTPDSQTIKALYNRVLLRDPKPNEVEIAQRFLNDEQAMADPGDRFLWEYGTTQLHLDEVTDQPVLTDFTPYTHFSERSPGYAWAPGPKIPDPKWNFAFWGSHNSHAGAVGIATTARWTAPFDGPIRIYGELKRGSKEGDGIHGWITSSRSGVLANAHVEGAGTVPMQVLNLNVKKGDIISFAVTCEANINSDGFSWSPQIMRVNDAGKGELLTDAKTDFNGPDHWPVKRSKPQAPLAQLVQVLLMSNEFQFVD
jgi:hypothetical protein